MRVLGLCLRRVVSVFKPLLSSTHSIQLWWPWRYPEFRYLVFFSNDFYVYVIADFLDKITPTLLSSDVCVYVLFHIIIIIYLKETVDLLPDSAQTSSRVILQRLWFKIVRNLYNLHCVRPIRFCSNMLNSLSFLFVFVLVEIDSCIFCLGKSFLFMLCRTLLGRDGYKWA